ncbi:YIP1 family protein [Halomarina litorea]|uniref:YIP1 family protein n=1 Tax=Halomarina litorea TaxID=2961595 RepID=UPI0020C2D29F|nr:YIP1 family protein [Halomarina sp. BCD28]
MTQWVETPSGGRDRGPAGLLRAWAEVMVRPRRFFRNGVAPGDQAPGLVFAVAVTLAHVTVRFLLDPAQVPVIAGRPTASLGFALLVAALIAAPLALHLTAALQTVLLVVLSAVGVVGERAGVSQTVQAVAYATAPCALSGAPVPVLQSLAAGYGFVLLVVGIGTVHDLSWPRALVATVLPGVLVFGYGFRGFAAAAQMADGRLLWAVSNETNATGAALVDLTLAVQLV